MMQVLISTRGSPGKVGKWELPRPPVRSPGSRQVARASGERSHSFIWFHCEPMSDLTGPLFKIHKHTHTHPGHLVTKGIASQTSWPLSSGVLLTEQLVFCIPHFVRGLCVVCSSAGCDSHCWYPPGIWKHKQDGWMWWMATVAFPRGLPRAHLQSWSLTVTMPVCQAPVSFLQVLC